MAGGLDGQRGVHAGGAEPLRLVDDVFIAPLEPAVDAAQRLLQKGLQTAGGDGVGDAV